MWAALALLCAALTSSRASQHTPRPVCADCPVFWPACSLSGLARRSAEEVSELSQWMAGKDVPVSKLLAWGLQLCCYRAAFHWSQRSAVVEQGHSLKQPLWPASS